MLVAVTIVFVTVSGPLFQQKNLILIDSNLTLLCFDNSSEIDKTLLALFLSSPGMPSISANVN